MNKLLDNENSFNRENVKNKTMVLTLELPSEEFHEDYLYYIKCV